MKISFVVKRIATDVLLFFTEFCLYNKQKNTWVLGNTRFISRVEHNREVKIPRFTGTGDILELRPSLNLRNRLIVTNNRLIID